MEEKELEQVYTQFGVLKVENNPHDYNEPDPLDHEYEEDIPAVIVREPRRKRTVVKRPPAKKRETKKITKM